MPHPQIVDFQKRLNILFDEVDDYLENTYAGSFSLRPNRPERGTTSAKHQDGLFNIGAQFTAGYYSKYGRGYFVDLKIASKEVISSQFRQNLIGTLQELIEKKLQTHFPERKLQVVQEKQGLKIIGDLNLGNS